MSKIVDSDKNSDEKKVALITGASRGIGRAMAIAAAGFDYDFFLTGRNVAELEKTAELVRKAAAGPNVQLGCSEGPFIVIHVEDLSRTDSADKLFKVFEKSFDRLDLLINNAGVVIPNPIGEYSFKDWDQMMNINARTPFFLIQHCIPMLKKADPGFIINIGSVVAHKGYDNQSVYSASKHALIGFTKAVARDVKDTRIRIHVINPGGVDTDLVRSVRPDIDTSEMIDPDEIADALRYLLSMKGNAMIDEINIRRKSKQPWD